MPDSLDLEYEEDAQSRAIIHNNHCIMGENCICGGGGQYVCWDCGATFEVGPDTMLECSECESLDIEKIGNEDDHEDE